MEYCPEIAVLHGTFALIEAESKSGKYDILQFEKGAKPVRLFQLLRDVLQEIVNGLESHRSDQNKLQWNKKIHTIFFLKAFVFNKRCIPMQTDQLPTEVRPYRVICAQMPDFHPFVFFNLSDVFGWTEFVAECLMLSDLQTVLHFSSCVLEFCCQKPSLLYDLQLISTTLNFLVSSVTAIACHPDSEHRLFIVSTTEAVKGATNVPAVWNVQKITEEEEKVSGGGELSFKTDRTVTETEEIVDGGRCGITEESEKSSKESANQQMPCTDLRMDDSLILESTLKLVDIIKDLLGLVQKRNMTSLYDRSSMKGNAQFLTVHILGQLLSSVTVFSIIAASTVTLIDLNARFAAMVWNDETDDDNSETIKVNLSGPSGCISESLPRRQISEKETPFAETKEHSSASPYLSQTLLDLFRAAETKQCILACLASFFNTPAKGASTRRLPTHKATQFGKILKLNLLLGAFRKPMKTVLVVQKLSQLLSDASDTAELQNWVSAMLVELERREELAENKRNNPNLAEVTEEVTKRLPRWKWCVQYGLAKRDLAGWWSAGFLDLLRKDPSTLDRESDVHHLLSVLVDTVMAPTLSESETNRRSLVELVLRVFNQLPLESQENVILHVYKDPALSSVPLVDSLDKSLTVAFNKLSAGTARKDVLAVLHLALQDPIVFTQHAVNAAVCSRGQISVVVKVLNFIPRLMKCINQLHHSDKTLLCHCLHVVLTSRLLDATQQKNMLKLVTSLLKTNMGDGNHKEYKPLLSTSEFINTSIAPFINLQQTLKLPVRLDFALRLLVTCLDVTLSNKLFDWLEDVHPVVMVLCCAAILQECTELVGEGLDTEWLIQIKSLALNVLERLHEVTVKGGCKLEDCSVAWLQEKIVRYTWTVCAYIAPFFMTSVTPDSSWVLAEFALEAERHMRSSSVMMLQLAAISDVALTDALDVVPQTHAYNITNVAMISSLCQVLPHLLTSEVKRVVQILSALVYSNILDIIPRTSSFDTALNLDCKEVLVLQLLTDSVVLLVSQDDLTSQALCHLAQITVAAFQALLGSDNNKACDGMSLTKLAFYHICIIMSASPDVALDPLFIVLLDLLAKLEESGSDISNKKHVQLGSLALGIQLIPDRGMRDTLCKKLKNCV